MHDYRFTCIKTNARVLKTNKNLPTPRNLLLTTYDDSPDGEDGKRLVSHPLTSSSSESSLSSVDSDTSREKIKENCHAQRKKATLSVDSHSILQIESIQNVSRGNKFNYHIIKAVEDVNIGAYIREYDIITSINGHDVKDTCSDDLQKIINKNETSGGKHTLRMTVWRWDNDGNINQLAVTITSQTQERSSSRSLSRSSSSGITLVQRRVTSLTFANTWKTISIRIADSDGLYFCVQGYENKLIVQGMVRVSTIPDENYQFRMKTFRCFVRDGTHVPKPKMGFVLSCTLSGVSYDVTSKLGDGDDVLQLTPHTDFTQPDERYFAIYDLGDGDDVIESLLFKNYCVKYNHDSSLLTVDELGISKPKSQMSTVSPSYRLQMFSERELVAGGESRLRCKARFRRTGRNISGNMFFCCFPRRQAIVPNFDGDISKDNKFFLESVHKSRSN